jgi:hypothetical protein
MASPHTLDRCRFFSSIIDLSHPWELRERNARGTLKYADGRVYEGEFGVKASHGFRG